MHGACDAVLETLHARAYAACIPLNVTLELTLRCNIRCTHCYNFDRGVERPRPEAELSIEEIRPLLDDLRAEGTLFLGLTGGEPMTHPRFWDVADEAAARGFALSLLSNGTLLTEAACDRLASYPSLFSVSLSAYGASPAVHDAVTRVPGSHRRTIDGARRLRDRGVAVTLKYVLMKGNAAEAAAFLELAEGFDVALDPTLSARYDGGTGSLADRVDPAELEALYAGPLRSMIGENAEHPTDDEFKCNCARGNAAVTSSGDVYPCIAAPIKAGNVRERRFGEIWRSSPVFERIRGLRLADFKTCAPCGLKRWCRRSAGTALLASGDYTGVDPWTCEEAAVVRKVNPGSPER